VKVARFFPAQSVAALAVLWMGFCLIAFAVFPSKGSYWATREEHVALQHRIDEGETDPRILGGAGLSEAFEYKANAAEAYLWSLESFLIIGVLPSVLIMLLALAGTTSKQKAHSVRNLIAKEGEP
jgi:hypothetical protein